MEQRQYDGVRETVYAQVLPDGLTVLVVPKKGFTHKYAMFSTDYGSVDTRFSLGGQTYSTPDGVAHYLEHKLFDTRDGNALQLLAATGASPNAGTDYYTTSYYFGCADRFLENLRTLLSFVSEPYFTEESVEKERGIIGQEIKMYEDDPGSRLGENLFEAMYQVHPLRVPIAGTVESISHITAQTLYDCHRAFYQPSNMVLCVAGDVDPEAICKLAEEVLPKTAGTPAVRDYGGAEPLAVGAHRIKQSMEVAMPMFALGFKCPEVPRGPERLRMELLGDLASELLVGESSPLYERLYEAGLIDSGFSVGYTCTKGLAQLICGGDSRDPEAVREAVLQEAVRIGQNGADEALFRRLKRSSLGRRIRGLDSFWSVCNRLALGCFDGCDYLLFPEVGKTITLEDTVAFLRENIGEAQAVLSTILPNERQE